MNQTNNLTKKGLTKEDKYPVERQDVADRIIKILDLKDNTFILYDVDNDADKQKKIMDLVGDINFILLL